VSGDISTAANNRLRVFQNGVRRKIFVAKGVEINVPQPITG
jgi:hypothetical protein